MRFGSLFAKQIARSLLLMSTVACVFHKPKSGVLNTSEPGAPQSASRNYTLLAELLEKSEAESIFDFMKEVSDLAENPSFAEIQKQLSGVTTMSNGFPIYAREYEDAMAPHRESFSLELVSDSLFRNFFPVYLSRGRGYDGTLPKPLQVQRYISFDNEATLALAFDNIPEADGSFTELEVIYFVPGSLPSTTGQTQQTAEPTAARYEYALWHFAKGKKPTQVLRNPEMCGVCHGRVFPTPLIEAYPAWPGMIPSHSAKSGNTYPGAVDTHLEVSSHIEGVLLNSVLDTPAEIREATSYSEAQLEKLGAPTSLSKKILPLFKPLPSPNMAHMDKRLGNFTRAVMARTAEILADTIIISAGSKTSQKKIGRTNEETAELLQLFFAYLWNRKSPKPHFTHFPLFLREEEYLRYQLNFQYWAKKILKGQAQYCEELKERYEAISKKVFARGGFESPTCTTRSERGFLAEVFAFAEFMKVPRRFLKESSFQLQGDTVSEAKVKKPTYAFRDGTAGVHMFLPTLGWKLGHKIIERDQLFYEDLKKEQELPEELASTFTQKVSAAVSAALQPHKPKGFAFCTAFLLNPHEVLLAPHKETLTEECRKVNALKEAKSAGDFAAAAKNPGKKLALFLKNLQELENAE